VADEHDPVKVKRIQNGHDVIDVVIKALRTRAGRPTNTSPSDSNDSVTACEARGKVIEVMRRTASAAREEDERWATSAPVEHF
jgi:hypothetical protein